jgi:hypothetical protein
MFHNVKTLYVAYCNAGVVVVNLGDVGRVGSRVRSGYATAN